MLRPGCRVAVEAVAPGYAPATEPRALVVLEPETRPIELRLTRGHELRGRVLAEESGAPIADALVQRFTDAYPLRRAPDSVRLAVRTEADGSFVMEGVPPGAMSLAVEHEDWAAHIDGPFEVPAKHSPQERVLHLGSSSTPRGRPSSEARPPQAEIHRGRSRS
jgi:hypothetical protein